MDKCVFDGQCMTAMHPWTFYDKGLTLNRRRLITRRQDRRRCRTATVADDDHWTFRWINELIKSKDIASDNRGLICLIVVLLLCLLCVGRVECEYVREFEIPENVPVGSLIGHIGESTKDSTAAAFDSNNRRSSQWSSLPLPPYLIVPVPGSAVDSDLEIDQSTGEIRTKIVLDRETKSYYSFVAIPLSGENIRVVINVLDENDNAPQFAHPYMEIEFPENSPRDSKRTLNPARDRDVGLNNVQQYKIVSGNTNNAFRLSSHRERDDVLYLDLQVNGFLDRETIPFYNLIIEAHDGGTPPRLGSITVNITIMDVNDNQPLFNQSRYAASVLENATIGASVLQVFATDADNKDNGQVSYSINRRQSDRESFFVVDSKSGVISVNRPLDFESKDVHELVVVARDSGAQPLETTAFVTVQVVDVNDNQPTINLIFLRDDASPKISEDAQPGEFVARISVNDPDSKTEYSNVNVTLEGGDGHFGLTTRDNIIYLVFVDKPLDRELQSNYTLVVTATDQGSPPLQVFATFDLLIMDVNDNAPEFEQTNYYANVLEVADPGTSVFQLSAMDRDEGNNSMISYSIQNTPESHSNWFQINSKTGLITTRSQVDCETNPAPKITVVATDHGQPSMSSTASVTITILDVNDNEPIFDQSFYNVSVLESETIGKCILKVSASDADCGVNGKVNYTLGDVAAKTMEFFMNPVSGELCIRGRLDREERSIYEFPVVAIDRGGLSTTAMAKIQVVDVNDNRPVFYPREYNVSLQEQVVISTPVIVVVATDADSDKYGSVTYRIVSGNDQQLFRIDEATGEVFLKDPLSTQLPLHHLVVSAVDGAGLASASNAHVWVSVIDPSQPPPIFDQSRYSFLVEEGVKEGAIVGTVRAGLAAGALTSSDGKTDVRYSINSGDPNGYFRIDPVTGTITANAELDHETYSFLLLNVQAQSGNPSSYGHTQANITIKDINDNAPIFDSPDVKISLPENAELRSTVYAAHVADADSSANGLITYRLLQNPEETFQIGPSTGYVTLVRHLDYESQQKYKVIVEAVDGGKPPLSSNMTLTVEIQDVNDNPPVFEKAEYEISVVESLAVNTQFLQVSASDRDTGNNARMTYIIKDAQNASMFGIFPNSGSLYLKEALDRETKQRYALTVMARDNGSPPLSATCIISVDVLDVNDNDPVFVDLSYEFFVWEDTNIGSHIGTVKAIDKDLGNNASLRYNIIPNSTYFHINSISGEITSKTLLDREQKEEYELTVYVHDKGNPPRQDSATVIIKIGDINDNKPSFIEPKEDVIGIKEELRIGTEVVQVQAIDKDNGFNGTITYSFTKVNDAQDADTFTINPQTGVISTAVVLDHEQKSVYRIAIMAKDKGTPPLHDVRVLQIEVLDHNDNRPTFSSTSITLSVQENVPLGSKVGTVNAAHSNDGTTGVFYSIIMGNVLGVFAIDRKSGVIYVVQQVDYEQAPLHLLQVKAIDNNAISPQGSVVNVSIAVEDVNDNAPAFEDNPIMFSVSESAAVGMVVGNVTAVDRDGDLLGLVRYSLKGTSKVPFEVDSVTGVITVKHAFDYELQSEYTLVIVAADSPNNTADRLESSATVKVMITDINDNVPRFVSRQNVNVSEDESSGFVLLNVIALDEDSGENGRVLYSITSGNKDGRFRLNKHTGLLTLAKPLDRELISKYTLNISASDSGPLPNTAYQVVTVFVEDANDNNPSFGSSTYVANISENAPSNTFLVRVQATDNDSGANANLTYFIPDGIIGDRFTIDSVKGEIRTLSPLDREVQANYVFTVYVRDDAFPARYDSATVIVSLNDVNDNVPQFHDSCYPLRIPENSDLSVVHTVVAQDLDSGPNGEVTYSIIDGNVGSKFSIDINTGQLTAAPLDRESVANYKLTILAHDNGDVPHESTCNITITVEDQNDNDPRFSQEIYTLTIPEDIAINTTVLVLTATDADFGNNAQITYSLSNETQWLFKIDSHSGAITTAGIFDREKRGVYSFEVRATDGGKYDARSEKALVQVNIGDVNDNKPVFSKYPFVVEIPAAHPPGSQVIQILAEDKDEGPNAEIVYSFIDGQSDKFRIIADSGIVTSVGNLEVDTNRVYYLNVLAQDKGKPPQTSTGVIQVHIGEQPDQAIDLRFFNMTYNVLIPENTPSGREVVQVQAVRSDNKKVGIYYNFSSGNEDGSFEIIPSTGVIRIKDPRRLDYETSPRLRLIVVARQIEEAEPLNAYTTVWVNLVDQNDNPPRFTQDHYVSAVWEGNSKGIFVMQVSATDDDRGPNSSIVYHIVDGNYDNAFIIEPPFSGIVKTNIVLDREIRDAYRLTIIAMDEGTPQLTGTCTLRINIIDVNDNRPTFPPQNVVSVSEGSRIGMSVTTITANDVDTNPALTYDFSNSGNPDGFFSIDRYSGHITLSKPLDHEKQAQHVLRIQASDMAHVVETTLTVNVIDENDNWPIFSQQFYRVTLNDLAKPSSSIVDVNATDADSGDNGRIVYLIKHSSVEGFYINEKTGVINTNKSIMFEQHRQTIQLVIAAVDNGSPQRTSLATVRLHVAHSGGSNTQFSQQIYTARIDEDAPRGTVVVKVSAEEHGKPRTQFSYWIVGNDKAKLPFDIDRRSGEIVLLRNLDREEQKGYRFVVMASNVGTQFRNSTAEVLVQVTDVNDNAPKFTHGEYAVNASESLPVGQSIIQVECSDLDEGDNGKLSFDISSGNGKEYFQIDARSGLISLKKPLDYEETQEYHLVVLATDGNKKMQLSALATVVVAVQDENDNIPHFPLPSYLELVAENALVGTRVTDLKAYDLDLGVYGMLNYSIVDGDAKDKFQVDSSTGSISTNAVFDFEVQDHYELQVLAADNGGKSATVTLHVDIESKDEFAPVFLDNYRFTVPGHVEVGYVVGRVEATDRDKGPDGRVVYQLRSSHPNFRINRTSGEITVKTAFRHDTGVKRRRRDLHTKDVSLVISASSGRSSSLSNITIVEVTVDFLNGTLLSNGPQESVGGLTGWTLGLVVALAVLAVVLFSVIVFLRLRNRRLGKSGMAREFESSFDTIDIRPPPPSTAGLSQYPPGYDDISHYASADGARHHHHRGNTTSEISDQSNSASSGRGSVEEGEDVEDEEIRMINEGPLIQQKMRDRLGMPDSGIQQDEDNLSESSVHNTQEYLARLGIDTTRSEAGKSPQNFEKILGGHSMESMHMFDDEGGGESDGVDITNLIYAKLNEVGTEDSNSVMDGATRTYGFADEAQMSMTGSLSSIVHSEEELTGSYNWDYLLDWGPQYQPLAHVFAEIARLKDDTVQHGFGGNQALAKKTLNPQVKTVPPPLITNVAPRSIAPVALSSTRSSHLMPLPSLPRSPIGHENTFMSSAMSPSFSPSLSPLATRSPSISPLVTPGSATLVATLPSSNPVLHHSRVQRPPTLVSSVPSETDNGELRI